MCVCRCAARCEAKVADLRSEFESRLGCLETATGLDDTREVPRGGEAAQAGEDLRRSVESLQVLAASGGGLLPCVDYRLPFVRKPARRARIRTMLLRTDTNGSWPRSRFLEAPTRSGGCGSGLATLRSVKFWTPGASPKTVTTTFRGGFPLAPKSALQMLDKWSGRVFSCKLGLSATIKRVYKVSSNPRRVLRESPQLLAEHFPTLFGPLVRTVVNRAGQFFASAGPVDAKTCSRH